MGSVVLWGGCGVVVVLLVLFLFYSCFILVFILFILVRSSFVLLFCPLILSSLSRVDGDSGAIRYPN